jgi:hypothetical protein
VPSISRALGTQWVILQRTMALRFHSVHDSWAAPVAQGGAPGRELFARRRDVGGPRRVSVRPDEQDSGPVRRGGDRRPYDFNRSAQPSFTARATRPSSLRSRRMKRPLRISSYRRDSLRLASGTRWPQDGG